MNIYGNPNVYDVAENIATKYELNINMISALNHAKSISINKLGSYFETSMVGIMGIFVALFNSHIGQGSFKSDKFVGITFMKHFFSIH